MTSYALRACLFIVALGLAACTRAPVLPDSHTFDAQLRLVPASRCLSQEEVACQALEVRNTGTGTLQFTVLAGKGIPVLHPHDARIEQRPPASTEANWEWVTEIDEFGLSRRVEIQPGRSSRFAIPLYYETAKGYDVRLKLMHWHPTREFIVRLQ